MASITVFKGSKEGPKATQTEQPSQLTSDQVLVKVTASGVCGTDLHYKKQDMVLGHEGVGIVQEVGPDAKYLKKGDRVGWGYETDACGHCIECLKGDENYCPKRVIYGKGNPQLGSFATNAVVREAFLHLVPEGLSDEDAAPLQCGGATVFNVLHDANAHDVIGIMGVGGLGHIAIQFAAKLGCRVVVISGSDRKKNDAHELGAHRFIATNGGKFEPLTGEWLLTRLLVTTSAMPTWDSVIPMMAPRSTIYPLSASGGNLEIPYGPLLLNGVGIQLSLVASRAVHRRMLDFAALHGIKPVIEKFPLTQQGVDEAITRLEAGKVRYRAVLVPEAELQTRL